jgi:hypothetical protein
MRVVPAAVANFKAPVHSGWDNVHLSIQKWKKNAKSASKLLVEKEMATRNPVPNIEVIVVQFHYLFILIVAVSPQSTAEEVQSWLLSRYNEQVAKDLRGATGEKLFKYSDDQLAKIVGKVEGFDLYNVLHPRVPEQGIVIQSYPILSNPILSYPILF